MGQMEQYPVCVVTGTRAEYGLLKPLLFKLRDDRDIDLTLAVTGSHLVDPFGNTQDEIIQDGLKDYTKIPIPMDDDSKGGMAFSTGVAMTKFAELFSRYRPAILIVLGDRFEIFAAAAAAHLIGIPIAHISGGDVTEGAVDDAIRHCITKMSQLHFPGCEQSAKRIIQMGEQPDKVFDVGEPGVENCLNMTFMSRRQLADDLSFEGVMGRYAVVTFHPVTMEDGTAIQQVRELIQAMDSFKEMSYVITMANADAGGRAVNSVWIQGGRTRSNWFVATSLGVQRYLSAVRYADLVIGNSSSGIVEAPSLGTATINIGDRQKGRMMAASVLTCGPTCEEIKGAMGQALEERFQEQARHVSSPFGDGTTSEKIFGTVKRYLETKGDANKKHFYDIEFSI